MKTPVLLCKLFLSLILTALCAICCAAQDDSNWEDNLEAKVSKISSVTYLDLIRKVFPDAQLVKKNASETSSAKALASKTIPLRPLFGEYWGKKNFGGEISLAIFSAQSTIDGRGKVLWLIIEAVQPEDVDCFDCQRRILAAYRVSKTDAELIDAADIKTDDQTGFDGDRPKLRIAAQREAIIVWNYTQLSIGQDTFSIIGVNKNGFDILLDQFDEQKDFRCGVWLSEEAKFRLLKTSVGGYRSIEIRVKTEGGGGDSDNPEVEVRRRFRYLYVWQPRTQKYKAVINPERTRRKLLKRLEPCKDYKNQ